MHMSKAPLSWLKKVEVAMEAAQTIPMWGAAPPFPIAGFGEKIGEALSLGEITTEIGKTEWREPEEMRAGLGSEPLMSGIELSPLETPVSFLIPSDDAEKLSRWALDPTGKSEGFHSHEMQKGFYRYLLLHLLKIADEMKACEDLTPKLTEAKLPKEKSYSVDVALRKGEETVWGRLICPPSFHAEYKMHFSTHPPAHYMQESTVPVTLAMTAGNVDLSLEEWKTVSEGDFLVLDQCTYHPEENSGSFLASLNEVPLFQIKAKRGALKILDYADYFEDNTMTDEFSDMPADFGDMPPPAEQPAAPQEPAPPAEEPQASAPPTEAPPYETAEAPPAEVSVDQLTDESRTEKMIKSHDIPLTITVEVARISITLNKLLEIKPGNTLDLAITPEKGVNLTVGGKVVGRGELLQIGETLGVQVTEVAHT
jgi:flagellar motor switch protein FliN